MEEAHYLALYRKYRPQTFEDVCGRDAIVRTLKNQITSGRLGHSYLFCGTRGTGKTTIAKIFAKAVNCEHPVDGNPCGECDCCRQIDQDANLNVVEMDAASNNGVDDIRSIIEQVSYSPTQGKYRVFIIDEVHMLSSAAFNALLKTLEEPPSYAIFILATTEPNKLPITILSRCQRYDFGRIPVQVIQDRLQVVCEREGLQCEERALRYIASAADGSLRDGLSILDQCNAFNYGNDILTYEKTLEILGAVDVRVFSELYERIHACDSAGALQLLDEILLQGRELVQFVTDFIGYLRNIMLLKASEQMASKLDVSADHLERMLDDARMSELTEIIRYINVFSALTESIRYSANRRILTETALIRLCEPSMDISEDTEGKVLSLMERVRTLENKIIELQKGGIVMSSAPMPQRMETSENTAAQSEAPKQPAKKMPLPGAISEDIQKVARDWKALIGGMPADQNYIKVLLREAHPSVGESGQLLIVFETFVGYASFDGPEKEGNRQYLRDYLTAHIGKELAIEYKLLDKGTKFTDNYWDLQNAIQLPIEQEED